MGKQSIRTPSLSQRLRQIARHAGLRTRAQREALQSLDVLIKPLDQVVHRSWVDVLTPVVGDLAAMRDYLRTEVRAGRGYLPAGTDILRAFQMPFDDVRVLLVGQEPYPRPEHPIGLAFAVRSATSPLPHSLQHIFAELADDVGGRAPEQTLAAWERQGVLLLNRVLTVAPYLPGSHRRKGWEPVTERVVCALAERDAPLVAILWGRDAQRLRQHLGLHPAVVSSHPSPRTVRTGFFGSRPFSRANELLARQGAQPVNWHMD